MTTTTTDRTHQAVEAAARDYIEGWFTADADRMARALHPQLTKHAVKETDGTTTLWTLTREDMIAATAGGGGLADAAAQTIVIDDIRVDDDIASARVLSTSFVDFLHLTRDGGTWRIVSAVWRNR